MKLFGSYTSPFVRHCRIVLLETELPCEFIETDQAGSAAQSPTKRVPFLQDGDIFFSDSSSIIKYLREKAHQKFCASTQELDEYCMVNTVLDASVNVFFLERDGVKADEVPYIQRQIARIDSSLSELNNINLPMSAPYNDAQLRLACYIGWAKFRNLAGFSLTEKSEFQHLEDFFAAAQQHQHFIATAPKG
jgi:glutathione S-transferase